MLGEVAVLGVGGSRGPVGLGWWFAVPVWVGSVLLVLLAGVGVLCLIFFLVPACYLLVLLVHYSVDFE